MSKTYASIERPYDNFLKRSSDYEVGNIEGGEGSSGTSISSPNDLAENSVSGSSFGDMYIENWIKSKNYKPKSQGFYIDGRTGYIECMQLYAGTGGIIGGSLDIPDTTTANSFHVDSTGNTWWGATAIGSATAKILNTGAATFTNVTITGGTIGGAPVANVGYVATSTADAVPTGLAIDTTVGTYGVTTAVDGSISAFVTVMWDAISTDTFDRYYLAYKKTSHTYFTYLETKATNVLIDHLTPNISYTFKVASINKYGSVSDFCTAITYTSPTSSTNPATVTGVTATGGVQYVIVEWDLNSETDIASYNIYRNTVNDSGTATLIGNCRTDYFIDGGRTGGVEYFYWLKALNTSGLLSLSFSDVASATPRNVGNTDIADSAVTAAKTSIASINPVDGEINANKIGTTQLDTNAVTEAKILDGAITAAKTSIAAINPVDGEINANKVGTTQLDTNAVTGAKILDGVITAAKTSIAAINPVTGEINANKVGTTQLDVNAVTEAKILDSSITAAKTSIAAINPATGEINANKIGTLQLDDNAVTESEIAAGAVTAGKTSIAAINSVDGEINANKIGTTQLVNDAVTEAKILDGAVTAAKTSIAAINAVDGEINANKVGTTQIDDDAVTESKIASGAILANKLTTYNFILSEGTFTDNSPSAGKIAWSGCKVVYNGTEYTIADGLCLPTDKHVYWQLAAPAVFSTSASLPTLGNDDFLVAFNNSGTTVLVWNSTVVNGNRITTGSITATNLAANTITANEIAAGTITADEIAAGAITASKLTTYNFLLSEGTFNDNTPGAGKVSWTDCKVVYNGTEHSITNGSCLATDKHIYWQLASSTVFSASATLPALGNDDFLVVFNDSGTAVYVWNSTVVNGNRITTGSITATNISSNTLTANEIAAGAITATEIAAGAVTAAKITSYNFVLSEGTFTSNSPDAGKIAWSGCKVVYNGTEHTITNGNCLTTDKHIYWQLASPTVFSASVTLPALGNDDFLVAFNDSGTAVYVWNSTVINGNRITSGSITATNIASNTITANEIAAGTITATELAAGAITASQITSYNFVLTAGTFTDNSPTAGKVSWSGCKVIYNGTEHDITDGFCAPTDKHIYWQLAAPTVFSSSVSLPSLGNEDFLVAFNNSGSVIYVWNSTVINGNRITSGSVTATNMAANTITANEIAAGTITATELAAGAVTATKLTTYNFLLSEGTLSDDSPSAGRIAWSGCKVVYNGTEHTITNGDCLVTDKHIYWQLASPTVFSASATLPALGNDDFLVAFNHSGNAIYVWNSTVINGNRITSGSVTATNMAANTITANEIAAGTITAAEIAAGAITATKLTTYNFLLSAGSFTNDSPTAGKISWSGCKVMYNGTEYEITDGFCTTTHKHVYWQLVSPTAFSTSETLPALGNDDFIVAFNNSGQAVYVWNSTVINGNRITAGSVTATNLAANTITANEIASHTLTSEQILAGTITADEIATNAVTTDKILNVSGEKVLIDGAVYLSDWRHASGLTKIDGGEIYTGSITTAQLNFTPVASSNVIATINASDEGITIDADNISISGSTTFASGYNPTTKVTTFAQADVPTAIAAGDLWYDTNDGNKAYRAAIAGANEITGGEWESVTDSDIAQAISDAATAQGTADGKVTTFYQDGVPLAEAVGDLWIDTNDGNKLYRAESIAADEIAAGEWVLVQDAEIADAIAAAGDAQSTADGKIVTFYQDGVPTSTSAGDLWVDTNDGNRLYRATGIGDDQVTAGEWVAVPDQNKLGGTGSSAVGGSYASAASDARVLIFPDANTGLQVIDDTTNDVFKCMVGGADVGDVTIGNYSGGQGIKYDKDAGKILYKNVLWTEVTDSGGTPINGTGNNDINSSGTVVRYLQHVFGDGSDGDYTTAGHVTQNEDVYYDDLTISTGHYWNTNGWRVFVKGTLTVNGTIGRVGNDGENGENGGTHGDPIYSRGTGGYGGDSLSGNFLSGATGGSRGGEGGSGTSLPNTDGGDGSGTYLEDGESTTNSIGANGLAGVSGGTGGDGDGVGNTGGGSGPAGIAGTVTQAESQPKTLTELLLMRNFNPDTPTKFTGSAGSGGSAGGGGGATGPNGYKSGGGAGGGGSGGQGGIVVICARSIVVGAAGIISVQGGNGGNGGEGMFADLGWNGPPYLGDAGGGGGGGGGNGGTGGVILLVYNTLTNDGVITAGGGNGGAAGAGGLSALHMGGIGGEDGTAGSAGSTGATGVLVQLEV